MQKQTLTLRIRLKDWKALRRVFPAEREESTADYIERVKEFMEEKWKSKR